MANSLSSFRTLIYRHEVRPRGILHIGAHQGQEVAFYRDAGVKDITLVEPVPELAAFLRREFYDIDVIEAAVGSREGVLPFYVMHPSNVSTLEKPGPGDRVERTVNVPVYRLSTVLDNLDPHPNILIVDAQGRELDVLKSGPLSGFHMVVSETSTVEDRVMASDYGDVVRYMEDQGFEAATYFSRTYDEVNRFARGTSSPVQGEIRDVVFVNKGFEYGNE